MVGLVLLLVCGNIIALAGSWLVKGRPPLVLQEIALLLREQGMAFGNIECAETIPAVKRISLGYLGYYDGKVIDTLELVEIKSETLTKASCIGRAQWHDGHSSLVRFSKTVYDGSYWIEYDAL